MAIHNFLAHVKTLQRWDGRPLIASLHPESIVKIPVLLTEDTKILFDAIRNDTLLPFELADLIHRRRISGVIDRISRFKQTLLIKRILISTGGNVQLVRAMCYHAIAKKDMLTKDVSYMFNSLRPEQKAHCIRTPFYTYAGIPYSRTKVVYGEFNNTVHNDDIVDSITYVQNIGTSSIRSTPTSDTSLADAFTQSAIRIAD